MFKSHCADKVCLVRAFKETTQIISQLFTILVNKLVGLGQKEMPHMKMLFMVFTDDLLTSLKESLGSGFTLLTNGNIIIGLAVLITLFSMTP